MTMKETSGCSSAQADQMARMLEDGLSTLLTCMEVAVMVEVELNVEHEKETKEDEKEKYGEEVLTPRQTSTRA